MKIIFVLFVIIFNNQFALAQDFETRSEHENACQSILNWKTKQPHVLSHKSLEIKNLTDGIRWKSSLGLNGEISGCKCEVFHDCFNTRISGKTKPAFIQYATWSLELSDSKGWIVSDNQGEFGGEVTWYSNDGLNKNTLLKDNSSSYFQIGENVYILVGLSHLDMSRGCIYRLVQNEKGDWHLVQVANFGENIFLTTEVKAECTFLIGESRIGKFCSNEILLIGAGPPSNKDVSSFNESILIVPDPTNVISDEHGDLYVGSSVGIVRIRTKTKHYQITWLSTKKQSM